MLQDTEIAVLVGAPEEIRTFGPQIRNLVIHADEDQLPRRSMLLRGSRCPRPAFIRETGIVHIALSKSISSRTFRAYFQAQAGTSIFAAAI